MSAAPDFEMVAFKTDEARGTIPEPALTVVPLGPRTHYSELVDTELMDSETATMLYRIRARQAKCLQAVGEFAFFAVQSQKRAVSKAKQRNM